MKPKAKGANCSECPLRENDFVPPCGPETTNWVVVGEAPGREEVREGRPFVGKAGKLLGAALEEANFTLDACWLTNTVLCRPPRNAKPSEEARACCVGRLEVELKEYPGADILLTGRPAASIIGLDKGVGGTRGKWYETKNWPDNRFLVTWHPAYILRKPMDAPDFLRDIEKFVTGHQEVLFVRNEPPKVVWLDTPSKIDNALGGSSGREFSWDVETNQSNWVVNAALMLGISFGGNAAYVIPADMLYDSPEAIGILNDFFARNLPIAHNGKFDIMFARKLGIHRAWVWFDTLLAHYVLDERVVGTHGLKKLSREYFDLEDYEMAMVRKYMKSKNDDWSKIDPNVLAQYLAIDVSSTYRLKGIFLEEMVQQGLYKRPFVETIMPFHELATEMEWNGMMVDVPHLEHYREVVEKERLYWMLEARQIAGKPDLNMNSWQQLAVVIWDERKLPQPPKRTWDKIKGQVNINPRSTSEVALFHLANVVDGEVQGFDDPFLSAMFKYRRRNKILGTYINKILNGRDANDRYHDDIKVWGTETGRFATFLHTIPRETVDIYGRMVRSAFIPAPGKLLVRADFSQAEFRSAGAVSNDQFIIDVYANERDLHSEVCEAVFGSGWGKEQRIIIKRLNFAYLYGGGRAALVSDTNIPKEESHRIMAEYNTKMLGLNEWKLAQQAFVIENGYIETPFGRRRRFPYINNTNYKEALKAAVNVPIQSAASDITHHAAVAVQKEGYQVILTKHDEIIAEVPEDGAEEHRIRIEQIMEEAGNKYLPNIKWKADASVRARWTDVPTS